MTGLMQKLEEEKRELVIKCDKLNAFIQGCEFNKIDFKHKTLLTAQYNTMLAYINVLELRLDDLGA